MSQLTLGGCCCSLLQVAPWQCRLEQESFGVVFALTASQLIMAHMCKEPFEPPLWAIGCLALAAANR